MRKVKEKKQKNQMVKNKKSILSKGRALQIKEHIQFAIVTYLINQNE